jgi:acid phosphatase type 7
MDRLLLVSLSLGIFVASTEFGLADEGFVVKPYLQLGQVPALSNPESLAVVWHARDVEEKWHVRMRSARNPEWRSASSVSCRRVTIKAVEPHRICTATLTGLTPGDEFDYELLKADRVVFAARGKARAPADHPYRFVVFGDCGTNTPNQRAVAYQTYRLAPDFVFITGDMIQYGSGRISEYRTLYFPIYNADAPSATSGVPLLRSRLFFSTPGNHDIGLSDLRTASDALGYFVNWNLPLNGPALRIGGPNAVPLRGAEEDLQAFLAAAGPAFPKMTMYSFDFGNSHWTVLDGNEHVDWTDYDLRNWVARDLAAATDATWKFVSFHQAAFDSNGGSRYEKMAIIADVLEHGGADVVFNGNTHNYQRSLPIRLLPKPGPCGRMICDSPRVDGDLKIDRDYDGVKRTRANGVVYVITGAGGSGLDEAQQTNNPATWQPFTRAFVADVPSLTVVDVNDKRLTVRQVSGDGQELDRFILTK